MLDPRATLAQSPAITYQGLLSRASAVAQDSTYRLTASLYSDPGGSSLIWRDSYSARTSAGVFELSLGSGAFPLPTPEKLDRSLWLGIALEGEREMRPLVSLSASPIALNVADHSITAQKMNTDYVATISVNGVPVTSMGSKVDFKAGEGIGLGVDKLTGAITIAAVGPQAGAPIGGAFWSESGNVATTPGTNYIGTKDSVALEIKVNSDGSQSTGSGRVMRFEPTAVSPNILAGYRGNVITNGAVGATLSGGGSKDGVSEISAKFGTVSGGNSNSVMGEFGTVSGGVSNTVLGVAYGGVVSGGELNQSQGILSTVSGGAKNWAISRHSSVGGGEGNRAAGLHATIAGGLSNFTVAEYAAIGGGVDNHAGYGSAIPGGSSLTIGDGSFGFNSAVNGSNVYPALIKERAAYLGNVNLWLGNTDGTARTLRFYEPNNVKDFAGTHYTSFIAPQLDTDVQYVLPNAQGGANTALYNDGAGNLSWRPAGPGSGDSAGWHISGNRGTVSGTHFLGTLDAQPLEIHVNEAGHLGNEVFGMGRAHKYIPTVLSPILLGGYYENDAALTAYGATIGGGGSIGNRNYIQEQFGTIGGGQGNLILRRSAYGTIAGGMLNRIDSSRSNDSPISFIGGGVQNTVNGGFSVIGGGSNNWIRRLYYSTIGGGTQNTTNGYASTVAGGEGNRGYSYGGFVGGGRENMAGTPNAGDTLRRVTYFSTVAGGQFNLAKGHYSFIGGGFDNVIDSMSESSAILGGDGLRAMGYGQVVMGHL